jgi:hypothetical protein
MGFASKRVIRALVLMLFLVNGCGGGGGDGGGGGAGSGGGGGGGNSSAPAAGATTRYFAYVAHYSSNDISSYMIDPATGAPRRGTGGSRRRSDLYRCRPNRQVRLCGELELQ